MLAFNNLIRLTDTGKLTSVLSITWKQLNSCIPFLVVHTIHAKVQLEMRLNISVISWTPFVFAPLIRYICTVSNWNMLLLIFVDYCAFCDCSVWFHGCFTFLPRSHFVLRLSLPEQCQLCVRCCLGWARMPVALPGHQPDVHQPAFPSHPSAGLCSGVAAGQPLQPWLSQVGFTNCLSRLPWPE